MAPIGVDVWALLLRALLAGAFDDKCGKPFRKGVVALKNACCVDRSSRDASRSAMLAGMWSLVACCIPPGLFQRTHLGARLRVLRFARMVERTRCDRCEDGDRAIALRGLGTGGGGGAGGGVLRLCATCRRTGLVSLERVRPFLGTTRLDAIPWVWLIGDKGGGLRPRRRGLCCGVGLGDGDKENVPPSFPPSVARRRVGARCLATPHALVEHVLAALD